MLGQPRSKTPIIGPKWMKLFALTVSFLGLQALWSVELLYGALTSEPQCHKARSSEACQFRHICYPGALKIPHVHRVPRGAALWSDRSTSRWYIRHAHHSVAFVLKPCNTGVLADNSKSRFGRRQPFMICGGIITAAATVLFGFMRPVARIFSEDGSGLVCISNARAISDCNLITHPVQGTVNMARRDRPLRHGFLSKCRRVSCGLLTYFVR